MTAQIPYIISRDAVPDLLQLCADWNYSKFFLVADTNTYRVLGHRVEMSLRETGYDVKPIVLHGKDISTDEHYVTETFVAANGENRVFLAVGSGTVTDITRFVSHRSRCSFISLPTAASVDGYTSTVAPMVVGNYKGPTQAQPPVAVIADLPTLCNEPDLMLAAGFGDLLGKFTSLADWRIGSLLYDEPFNEDIATQMRQSVDKAIKSISSLAAKAEDGIINLMNGLVGSGFGMLEFGDSRPASGSEHHLAHYWEMRFILDGRPPVLHGIKVGIATIMIAKKFEQLRQMNYDEASERLSHRKLDNIENLKDEIHGAYGSIADKILQIQEPLLQMNQDDLKKLKTRILKNWREILEIARDVPTAEQLISWIKAVKGPTSSEEIGLSPEDVKLGLKSAHLSRDRFTLNRLAYWLHF